MTGERPRRLVVVMARYDARSAAPPGIEPDAFARSVLADTYEVAADLVGVGSALVGPAELDDLLWPGSVRFPERGLPALVEACTPLADELVLIPADTPDLPGLVLAKVFKVLHRTDLVVAPERAGPGCVALGLRLPAASWIPVHQLDLDVDPRSSCADLAPGRSSVATTPDWHRLRGPAAVDRLDPRLEGWEETRALLSGRSLRADG